MSNELFSIDKKQNKNILGDYAKSKTGFKPSKCYANQLLSITREICISFDHGLVGDVYLDTSKAFDNVRREGLIFNHDQYNISGDLLNVPYDFIDNKK